ncbi:MAG: phage major capsid protein [Candidatus Bathyarchaeota archaeon]|nr:phage major capsid protein [Candidatus Bathyarchaeota archaeon]
MKPRLFESVMKAQSEQRLVYERLKEKTEHPFLKRYLQVGIKEGLFSDSVGALGRMHDTLVQAAYPELIGREIIKVKPTSEALERFPLDAKAIAYVYAEGSVARLSGNKYSTVDIATNVLADASEEWTREFVEDATWNVMDNMVEKVGLALGELETQKILDLYGAIAAEDLAGGGALSGGGTALNWQGLLKLHNAVRGENWRPNVLVLHETQLHQLLNDDKFVNAQYLPSGETDVDRGFVTSVLGMKVHASTLVPNGTAYAIDTRVAAVMLLRRDVTVEDWENPQTGKYGVRATTRFGLGVLRSKAVAKMTNIATTL